MSKNWLHVPLALLENITYARELARGEEPFTRLVAVLSEQQRAAMGIK